jgi:hypothetical protein
MRRIIFLVVFIFISITLFANDTFYYLAGGNLIPAEPNQTNVEMVEEVIDIDLFDDYYSVTVDFTFFNHGADENLLVGFPYLLEEAGGTQSIKIYDFRTWVNNELVSYSTDRIEIIDYSGRGNIKIVADHAFIKNVCFSSNEITKTKVEYKSEYGRASPGYLMPTYYYGSGRAWKDSIGKMTINIKNHISSFDPWIYNITMPEITYGKMPSNIPVENYINWNNGYLQIQLSEIEPNENDTIAIWIENVPLWHNPMKRIHPNGFPYRTQLFDNKSLRLLSKQQLRIARNNFYAIYGYNFKDETLKSYFQNLYEELYVVDENFNENMFTEIERSNINKILEEERKR